MGICSRCSVAVEQLGPHNRHRQRDVESKVTATLPRYGDTVVLECWICNKFSRWLEIEDGNAFTKWRTEALDVEYSRVASLVVAGAPEGVLPHAWISVFPPGYTEDSGCWIDLTFIPAEEAVPSVMPSGRSNSSKVELDLIKSWFEKCTRDHEKCSQNDQVWFPSRLIHIGANIIRLIITEENRPVGPYMTLSHRWGKQKYKKLKSSTMAQLKQAIDSIRLPRAFQDAIKIARHLGIDYLWVDSLCIKQDEDDLGDWLVESEKMGQIYRSACLNVSATWAIDGSERLLGKSNWTSKFPSQIELNLDGGPPRKYYIIDGALWEDEVERGPLNTRGWVFQERILARRVVHFGQTQLGWECKHSRALGMLPDGLPFWLGVSQKPCIDTLVSSTSHITQEADEKFAKNWQHLMGQFTACQLSFPTDKLIALEGIVRSMMQTRLDDTYAAGMWISTALFDLPWWRFKGDQEEFPIAKTYLRAPSWSWASVDGDITFPLAHSFLPHVRDRYATVKGLTGRSVGRNGDIIDSGTMQIDGICMPMSLQWSKDNDVTGFSVSGFQFSAERRILESSVYLESSQEAVNRLSRSGKLLLMPLFTTANSLFCIILEKTRGPGAHRRIGSAEIAVMAQTDSQMEDRDIVRIPYQSPSSVLQAEISGHVPVIWNKPAIGLISHLRQQNPPFRLVTIL